MIRFYLLKQSDGISSFFHQATHSSNNETKHLLISRSFSGESTSMIKRLSNHSKNFSQQVKCNVDVYESLKRISSILVAAEFYKSLSKNEILEAFLEKVDTVVCDERLVILERCSEIGQILSEWFNFWKNLTLT